MDLDRFDWLARRVEAAIDPQRRIIDPHHHLWDRGGSTYLAPQLLDDLNGTHNIVKTVFVECLAEYDKRVAPHLAPGGETRFVADQADRTEAAGGPTIAGIVSHADLLLGDAVVEVLLVHEAAGRGRFRGIRHATAFDPSGLIGHAHTRPPDGAMATDEFRAGLRVLAGMGHSFDAWLYHPQLGELAALAADVPEATIVLNHLGAPLGVGPFADDRDGARRAWRAGMEAVAANPNVMLKVGGIGMDNYYGTGWSDLAVPPSSETVAAFWSDAVRYAIDLFGPDRCMFESNFPVDRQSLTYPVLWNAFQIIAAFYTDQEQDRLFAGTAEEVYRLS
jgi:predicted TIM-barrel fold metal-dependent hydrolase